MDARSVLKEEMAVRFPGLRMAFDADPDDSELVYAQLFGVPGDRRREAIDALWDAIGRLPGEQSRVFIPSVKTLSVTKAYYPEMLPAVASRAAAGYSNIPPEIIHTYDDSSFTGTEMSGVGMKHDRDFRKRSPSAEECVNEGESQLAA